MAATKITTSLCIVSRFISAGPGQKPAKPQPIPNIAEPMSRRASIAEDVGNCMGSPSNAVLRRLANMNATNATAMAPIMTNARDGSQVPKKSRKF